MSAEAPYGEISSIKKFKNIGQCILAGIFIERRLRYPGDPIRECDYFGLDSHDVIRQVVEYPGRLVVSIVNTNGAVIPEQTLTIPLYKDSTVVLDYLPLHPQNKYRGQLISEQIR